MKDISLNFQELAFIMEIPVAEARVLFEKIIGEKPKVVNYLSVSALKDNFGTTRSLNQRYDGVNQLVFNLRYKAKNYLKYVNDKSIIKKKGFTGGKKIFYKIMSDEQKKHFERVINYKYKYLYKK